MLKNCSQTKSIVPHRLCISANHSNQLVRPKCNIHKSASTAQAAHNDSLYRTLSDAGEIAVLVVDGSNLVNEAVRRHKTAPTSSAAFGRVLLGTLLMGCFRKADEVVQVEFRGDGPIGNILAIANTQGLVKGRLGNPEADPPLRDDGKLNVGEAVGRGVLAVTRSHPLEPQPYTGMTPIVTGEIAEDLANYMVDSEQTNSALSLGVSIGRDLNVRHAGGLLVQILPFCSDETLEVLEANLSALGPITKLMASGLSAQDIAARVLGELGESPGGLIVRPKYGPCEEGPLKQRMLRAVASLGEAEVKDIVQEQGHVEVTCDFCCQTYQFSEEDVLSLMATENL